MQHEERVAGEIEGRELEDARSYDRMTEMFSGSLPLRPWERFLQSIAGSKTFVEEYWAKKPLLFKGKAAEEVLARCFTMADVASHAQEYPSTYAAQGCLAPDGKGGW